MPTLLDFRRRIRSVKNTQQITRAMKFIAAARLRRAQETAVSLRPYAGGIREILRSAMSRIENPEQFPMLAHRPEEKVLVLVTSGERGLCGAFNANNVLRRAFDFLR
jgi:F-type H+-transporting ATPase subunit gamma